MDHVHSYFRIKLKDFLINKPNKPNVSLFVHFNYFLISVR